MFCFCFRLRASSKCTNVKSPNANCAFVADNGASRTRKRRRSNAVNRIALSTFSAVVVAARFDIAQIPFISSALALCSLFISVYLSSVPFAISRVHSHRHTQWPQIVVSIRSIFFCFFFIFFVCSFIRSIQFCCNKTDDGDHCKFCTPVKGSLWCRLSLCHVRWQTTSTRNIVVVTATSLSLISLYHTRERIAIILITFEFCNFVKVFSFCFFFFFFVISLLLLLQFLVVVFWTRS